jgi:hypothetical protein
MLYEASSSSKLDQNSTKIGKLENIVLSWAEFTNRVVFILPILFQGPYITHEGLYAGPESVYLVAKCYFRVNRLRELGPLTVA